MNPGKFQFIVLEKSQIINLIYINLKVTKKQSEKKFLNIRCKIMVQTSTRYKKQRYHWVNLTNILKYDLKATCKCNVCKLIWRYTKIDSLNHINNTTRFNSFVFETFYIQSYYWISCYWILVAYKIYFIYFFFV